MNGVFLKMILQKHEGKMQKNEDDLAKNENLLQVQQCSVYFYREIIFQIMIFLADKDF